MHMTHPFRPGYLSSERQEVKSSLHIPMVYESTPQQQEPWEYRVETLDVREEGLLDAARLNELGKEGWLLVSLLDENASGKGSRVHYYFVRASLPAAK